MHKKAKDDLYQLICEYLLKKIGDVQFSLKFKYIYSNILNYNDLSIEERSSFLEIALLAEKVLSPDKRLPEEKMDKFLFRQLHDLLSRTKQLLPIKFITSEYANQSRALENFNTNESLLNQRGLSGFKKSDKRRLYELIQLYLLGQIDEVLFCDEFYYCYDIELEDELSDLEETTFNELSVVSGRFSPFQEDHKKTPGTYYTIAELQEQILGAKKKLESYFNELEKKKEILLDFRRAH